MTGTKNAERIEVWKNVKGYKGFYKVSTFGRVKSVSRYVKHWRGGLMYRRGVVLKYGWANGYPTVQLSKDGVTHCRTVHSLVLETFVGPCPEGMEARHFPDRTKTNNRIWNLSYCTPRRNQRDRRFHKTDRYLFGEDCPPSKLTNKKVRKIRRELVHSKKGDMSKIADREKVSLATISNIKHNKNWRKI